MLDYRNYKAVIFDLDGTLVDSMWMWKQIDIDFLGRFGLECPDDLQDNIEGMNLHETAAYFKERFHIPMSIEEMPKVWNEMAYQKYRDEVPLKKGALRFLNALKKENIKIGIATSNSIELVMTVLNSLNIGSYIDAITTSMEAKRGKPFPDVFLLAANKLQVAPEACLVFEDILPGITAGQKANMKVIAVADEYSKEYWDKKIENADAAILDYDEYLERLL